MGQQTSREHDDETSIARLNKRIENARTELIRMKAKGRTKNEQNKTEIAQITSELRRKQRDLWFLGIKANNNISIWGYLSIINQRTPSNYRIAAKTLRPSVAIDITMSDDKKVTRSLSPKRDKKNLQGRKDDDSKSKQSQQDSQKKKKKKKKSGDEEKSIASSKSKKKKKKKTKDTNVLALQSDWKKPSFFAFLSGFPIQKIFMVRKIHIAMMQKKQRRIHVEGWNGIVAYFASQLKEVETTFLDRKMRIQKVLKEAEETEYDMAKVYSKFVSDQDKVVEEYFKARWKNESRESGNDDDPPSDYRAYYTAIHSSTTNKKSDKKKGDDDNKSLKSKKKRSKKKGKKHKKKRKNGMPKAVSSSDDDLSINSDISATSTDDI